MSNDKAPTRQLLAAFDLAHRDRFGVPAYPLSGREAKVMKEAWEAFGTDPLLQIIAKFFEGNDFADQHGYSVAVFRSQVPKCFMAVRREQSDVVRFEWRAECEDQHGGTCATAYVHALRRKTA